LYSGEKRQCFKQGQNTLKKGVPVMFKKLISVSIMLATLAFSGGFAAVAAQAAMCTKRENLLKALDQKYKESRHAIGLISSIGVLEVYASKKGTWTVFVTNPSGVSCIVAAGDSFEQVPSQPGGINGPDA
jgi:hypothetical protein